MKILLQHQKKGIRKYNRYRQNHRHLCFFDMDYYSFTWHNIFSNHVNVGSRIAHDSEIANYKKRYNKA
jgi:hypothetical protein